MERLLALLYLYLATPGGLSDSRAAGLLASEFGDMEANRQTVHRYRVTAFGGGVETRRGWYTVEVTPDLLRLGETILARQYGNRATLVITSKPELEE